jgi:DNA-directed RNA polymerase II subunit RPB1
MAGRIGLIDTAVKTSETGYIQRRLIKGLEDLMVAYDMTVRTNKNKIVQFRYGDDNINPIKVENQSIPIVNMTVQEIFSHYFVPLDSTKILNNIYTKSALARHKSQLQEINAKCNTYTTMMLEQREKIVKYVFKNKESKNVVNCPVAFQYIINNVQGQMNFTNTSMVDITFLEAFQMIEECYNNLEKLHYSAPTELLKTLYYYYLSPKELLVVKRFNKNALTLLLSAITLSYKQSIVSPGEMVGIIAGQSIGEVSTQMTLNTFHFAGVASKSNVTRGVPRMQELLSLTEEIKNPSLTVYLKPEDQSSKETATKYMHMITHTSLEDIVESIEICFDPDDSNTLVEEDKELIEQYRIFNNLIDESNEDNENSNKSKWIIRMVMDPETMFEKNITMDDVNFTLKNCYKDIISCVFSDYNSDKLVFRIRMNEVVNHAKNSKIKKSLDQTDQIYVLQSFQEELLKNVVLRGVKGIDQVVLRRIKDNFVEQNGSFKTSDMWVLDTVGSNLVDILGLDYIDNTRTFSNNVVEIYDVLGIEAARQAIYNEFVDVIEYDGNYINYHHYCVLADRMTFTHKLISIYRHGINNDNIGPIAKATFEETPEMFLKAARHGELDTLRGVSANIMCGQEGFYGTSAFQVVLDIEKMQEIQETSEYKNINENAEIERFLGSIDDPNDVCSIKNLEIRNNVGNIKSKIVKEVDDNDYNPGF